MAQGNVGVDLGLVSLGLPFGGTSAPHIPTFGGPLGILSIVMGILSAADQARAQQAALEGNQELLKKIFEGYGEAGKAALAVMSGTQSLGEWTQKYGSVADQQNKLYFGDEWTGKRPQLEGYVSEWQTDIDNLRKGGRTVMAKYGIRTDADRQRIIGELEGKVSGAKAEIESINKAGPGGIVGQYDKLNTEAQGKIAGERAKTESAYKQREADVFADVDRVGEQARKDINARWAAAANSAFGNAAARGLGGSSIAAGNAALISRERGDELRRLAEDQARMRAGYRSGLRGEQISADTAFGNQGTAVGTDLGTQRIGAWERGGQNYIGAIGAGAQGALNSQDAWLQTLGGVSIPYPEGSPFLNIQNALGAARGGTQPQVSGGSQPTVNANVSPGGLKNFVKDWREVFGGNDTNTGSSYQGGAVTNPYGNVSPFGDYGSVPTYDKSPAVAKRRRAGAGARNPAAYAFV